MAFGTITRFRISPDEPPTDFEAGEILAKLRRFCFQPIDEVPEEESFGWTSFDDMLDREFQITPPEKGEYLAFAFRVDSRKGHFRYIFHALVTG